MRHRQASLAHKREGKKGVRGLAGQRGALVGGDHGDIPARWAGGGDAYLSSDFSPPRIRFSIFSGSPGFRRRLGPVTEGGLQLEK